MTRNPQVRETLRWEQFLAQHEWRREQALIAARAENAQLRFILAEERKEPEDVRLEA